MRAIRTWGAIALGLLLPILSANGQAAKAPKSATVAFYNVENLFDTENDPKVNDDEFTPTGANLWTLDRYAAKLKNLASVIGQIGDGKGGFPVAVGLAEVENRKVVEDLIATSPLSDAKYGIVHFDSPDIRGIDVALIYLKNRFKPVRTYAVPFVNAEDPNFKTRDVLVVSGKLDGELVHFVVNHWPSRRGGDESATLRGGAASNTRSAVDAILKKDPKAKVIVMGDLNDNPTDESLLKELKAKGTTNGLAKDELYNPMVSLFESGIGTLPYKGAWNLFDQFIVTQGFLNAAKGFKFDYAKVYSPEFLKEKEGKYAGNPYRTYAGKKYLGGYSDHFPVYMTISRK